MLREIVSVVVGREGGQLEPSGHHSVVGLGSDLFALGELREEYLKYTYGKSDSSKKVAIPNYYYKALLQRRGTGDNSTYQAMAIWVPHTAASGSATLDDIITIDQLEELTGIDFFHNLDDATEQRVESTITPNYWGFK